MKKYYSVHIAYASNEKFISGNLPVINKGDVVFLNFATPSFEFAKTIISKIKAGEIFTFDAKSTNNGTFHIDIYNIKKRGKNFIVPSGGYIDVATNFKICPAEYYGAGIFDSTCKIAMHCYKHIVDAKKAALNGCIW